jgi:hypothetical protein
MPPRILEVLPLPSRPAHPIEPTTCIMAEHLKCARDPQILRDMLTLRPTGENAVFNQTAHLKLSRDQQSEHDDE